MGGFNGRNTQKWNVTEFWNWKRGSCEREISKKKSLDKSLSKKDYMVLSVEAGPLLCLVVVSADVGFVKLGDFWDQWIIWIWVGQQRAD